MIKRIITNRRKHQKNIFKLSKSKQQYSENIIDTKKSDNKKIEYIYSNR